MVNKGVTRNPSPYPRLLFHAIRLAQFISAGIVTALLGFFSWYLRADGYDVPWTFVVLLSVSAFTVVSVCVTAFFYHFRVLRPKLSVFINAVISALWMMGFGMLTYYIHNLLTDRCLINDDWPNETGVMVCRMYKAVETFTITGMLTTLGSLLLDIHVLRKTTSRGSYNVMQDMKAPQINRGHPHHSDNDDFSHRLTPEDAATAYPAAPYSDRPGHSRSHSREPSSGGDLRRPYQPYQPLDAGKFGYARPEEQTTYEGAGGRHLDAAFAREGA